MQNSYEITQFSAGVSDGNIKFLVKDNLISYKSPPFFEIEVRAKSIDPYQIDKKNILIEKASIDISCNGVIVERGQGLPSGSNITTHRLDRALRQEMSSHLSGFIDSFADSVEIMMERPEVGVPNWCDMVIEQIDLLSAIKAEGQRYGDVSLTRAKISLLALRMHMTVGNYFTQKRKKDMWGLPEWNRMRQAFDDYFKLFDDASEGIGLEIQEICRQTLSVFALIDEMKDSELVW